MQVVRAVIVGLVLGLWVESAAACRSFLCDYAAVIEKCQAVAEDAKKIWEAIYEFQGRQPRWEWEQIEHNFEDSKSLFLTVRLTAERDRDLFTREKKTWENPQRDYRFVRVPGEGLSCEAFDEGAEIVYQAPSIHCDNIPPNEERVYWREECLLLVREVRKIHPATTPAELVLWERISLSREASDYADYLRQFPNGGYSDAAKRRVKGLEQADDESADLFEEAEQEKAGGKSDEAFVGFERAAYANDIAAQVSVGHMYLNGIGTAPNEFEAFFWFYEAALAGDPDAQTMVGVLMLSGRGTERDVAKARDWLSLAVEQNYVPAMTALGKHLRWSNTEDQKRGLELLERAVEAGDAEAQFDLASHLSKSYNPDQDLERSLSLTHSAAVGGFASAQVELARMYYTGDGAKIDYKQAETWARLAAEQQNAAGLRMLGVHYYYGIAVEQDTVKARELLEQAAAKGDEVAKRSLELMDERGH